MADDHTREIIAQNMNDEMLECGMSAFVKDYCASKVPPALVSTCMTHLKNQGLILKDNTWRDFRISPLQSNDTEDVFYKPLEPIVKAIFDYVLTQEEKKNRFAFKMVPRRNLTADIPGTNHRMDACIFEPDKDEVNEDGKKEVPLANHCILVPIECKMETQEDDDSQACKQLFGDCHHILCDDPRRMFMYGVTIVSDQMTAWYFSRSHSAKSMSFEWRKDDGINWFIELMLSFALATPEGLGIDPHVHKAPVFPSDDGQQYVYEIETPPSPESGSYAPPAHWLRSNAKQDDAAVHGKEKRFFRTVNILGPERPLCITGRATRVWIVQEVASVEARPPASGEKIVLKDVWIDSKERTEVENLNSIFLAIDQLVDNAEQKYPGTDSLARLMDADPRFKYFNNSTKERLHSLLSNKNYQSLFLTALHAFNGEKTKPCSKHVRIPKFSVFAVETEYGWSGSANSTQRSMGTCGSPAIASVQDRGPRSYDEKTRRFFVYKDVCVPSYNLPTFGDAMDIIRQALDAIQILYCARWVHRDISAGNVLAVKVEENGKVCYRVKLSDFEFAQPIGTTTHHSDSRMGTPFFMSVEIMSGQYLLDTIREFERPVSKQRGGVVTSSLADLFVEPEPAESPWGIQPDHALFDKLKQFKHSPKYLPVPPNATADGIPDYCAAVSYNHQHDLESIWWMIIYFITMLANHGPSHELGQTWFTHNGNLAQRKGFLRDCILSTFRQKLKPEFASIFPGLIEMMREALWEEYIIRALYGQLKDDGAYSRIQDDFAQLVGAIVESQRHGITAWATVQVKEIGDMPSVKINNSIWSSGQAFKRTSDSDVSQRHIAKKQRTSIDSN